MGQQREIDGSLSDFIERVRSAFDEQFRPVVGDDDADWMWVNDVFENHVIVHLRDEYFRVPMSVTDDEVIFGERGTWERVELTYVAAEMASGRLRTPTQVIGEFRGGYPAVPVAGQVDVATLTEGDDDPFYVTLPVLEIDRVSDNGLLYDEALVSTIERQLVGRGGIMGHIPDDQRDSAFPIEDVDWVGVRRVDKTTWAKFYVPPGEAREYIRRLMARGGRLGTSIYGTYDEREALDDGTYRLLGFQLESLDLAPPDRAALKLGGAFTVTAEMENETEDDMPTKAEFLAELTLKDIPQALREQVIQEYARENDADNRLAELEQQVEDKDEIISELTRQLAERKQQAFEDDLDQHIAELTNWNIEDDDEDAQKKIGAVRRNFKRAVLSQMGDTREAEDVDEVVRELWNDEFKVLAELVRDSLAGPSAVVSRKIRGTRHKLEDTPENRRKARSEMGF